VLRDPLQATGPRLERLVRKIHAYLQRRAVAIGIGYSTRRLDAARRGDERVSTKKKKKNKKKKKKKKKKKTKAREDPRIRRPSAPIR